MQLILLLCLTPFSYGQPRVTALHPSAAISSDLLANVTASSIRSEPAEEISFQNEPVLNKLLVVLETFQKNFRGLSFRVVTKADGLGEHDHGTIWVSTNGNVLKKEGFLELHDERWPVAALASRKDGWCFNAGVNLDGQTGMTVTFYNKHSSAPLATVSPEAGFCEHLTGAEYARESECTIERSVIEGKQLWSLKCDHPQGPTMTFFFDDDLRLKYFERYVQSGDKGGLGARFVKPQVVPEGVWAKRLSGPIEYIEFEGRSLPKAIPFKESGEVPGMNAEDFHIGELAYSDYQLLTQKLTSKIQFNNLKLPDRSDSENGKVTSQGEQHIRYEVHDGRLVKMTDTQAVDAANRARMGKGKSSWYAILGIVLLVAVVVLVWYRKGNR